MCGIAGILRLDGRDVDPLVVAEMSATVAHRGPDDSGQWTNGVVGLGHRRLSIIDPVGSPQPMATEDGRFHIVFNGEIFNYRQLRDRFDYPFRTNGDTEVVLALFARHGVDALQQLRGQFAFAVHDRHTGRLVLARDRMGVLPLYYRLDASGLVFGSEVKALWPALAHGPKVDRAALAQFLMRRAVPAPETLFDGVRKLPPGHWLAVGPDQDVTVQAYWQLPPPSQVHRLTTTEALDLVDGRLQDAVRDAMVADVPVGSYLSGGVDSSLVVAMASRLTNEPLHTFCASFGDARYDETPQARAVSELFGTDHHEVAVSAADFQDLWPRLTWNRDAPISEPADIAVFRLAEEARRYVKVALSGEGSDELFGGYPKYRFAGVSVRAGLVPGSLRSPALMAFERALPARANRLRIAARALAGPSTADRVTNWFAPFTTYEVSRLLGAPVADPTSPTEFRDPVDLMCRMDLASWLADNLLERGDRMSMAASLELRPPFLDHRLVETALRLPSDLKVRDGQTKWVLKAVAARYLPETITQRRKIGFKVPMDAWFRDGLQDLSRDLLLSSDSLSAQILDRSVILGLLDSHDSGRRNEESRIWTLLSLEQWARTCLYATDRPGDEDASCHSAGDRLQGVIPHVAGPGVA